MFPRQAVTAEKDRTQIFNELTKQRILAAFIAPDMRHDLMRDILRVVLLCCNEISKTNTNRHFDQFVSFQDCSHDP